MRINISFHIRFSFLEENLMGQHFPGGTKDKKRPVNAKEHRFDPCSGTIPQVMGQLSPCVTTAEPRAWGLQLPSQRFGACGLQLPSQRTHCSCLQ